MSEDLFIKDDYMRRWLYLRIAQMAKYGHWHPVIGAWGNEGVMVRKKGDMEFQADTFGNVLWKVCGQVVARFGKGGRPK